MRVPDLSGLKFPLLVDPVTCPRRTVFPSTSEAAWLQPADEQVCGAGMGQDPDPIHYYRGGRNLPPR